MRKSAIPFSMGERYGRLVIVSRQEDKRFLCQCDCGNTKLVSGPNLRGNQVRSCGCLAREYQTSAKSAHGDYVGGKKHHMRSTYDGMVTRCGNPNAKSYPAYGGRGIKVCDRWLGKDGYVNFRADMGERPEGMTLDRKDVHGPYSPENCRWATQEQQNANRRKHTQVEVEYLRRLEKFAFEHGFKK